MQRKGTRRKLEPNALLKLRLDGLSYQGIANVAGITRQRVQQLLSPPRAIYEFAGTRAGWRCEGCAIQIFAGGHIHHKGARGQSEELYNDPLNLQLLCLSCHRQKHL